jgi:hypothetical protein
MQQRAVAAESSFVPTDRPWSPAVIVEDLLRALAIDAEDRHGVDLKSDEGAPGLRVVPEAEDTYVSIDELIDDVLSVTATPWPKLDRAGRLAFDEDGVRVDAFAVDALQEAVDAQREAIGQLARPLRIGDTFLVRGYDAASPGAWTAVVDVTGEARFAAKRVLFQTMTGQDPTEHPDDGPDADEPPPAPPEPSPGPPSEPPGIGLRVGPATTAQATV